VLKDLIAVNIQQERQRTDLGTQSATSFEKYSSKLKTYSKRYSDDTQALGAADTQLRFPERSDTWYLYNLDWSILTFYREN
jgi:hypothetical protein